MGEPPRLRELQRRLADLIACAPPTEPGGVRALAAAAEGAAVIGDETLDAGERVAIYARMFFARIRDAIAEDYPALRAALGDARFDDLVRAYVAAHPPHDPSLRRAADALADFVADAHDLAPEPWAVEIARLERAMVAAFDAPDERPLTRPALAALEPARWPALEIRPARSLVLLACRFPVDEIRERLLAGEALARAEPRPVALRVWRQDLRVYLRRIDPLEETVLRAASRGATFGDLCERIIDGSAGAAASPASDAHSAAEGVLRLLDVWLDDELLLDTVSEPHPGG